VVAVSFAIVLKTGPWRGRALAFFLTLLTIQFGTEKGVPPFLRQYPRTACHRRLMPHMLAMAAAKVGHPMTFLILVITDNGLLHNDAPRFFTFPLADAAICTTGLADTCM